MLVMMMMIEGDYLASLCPAKGMDGCTAIAAVVWLVLPSGVFRSGMKGLAGALAISDR